MGHETPPGINRTARTGSPAPPPQCIVLTAGLYAAFSVRHISFPLAAQTVRLLGSWRDESFSRPRANTQLHRSPCTHAALSVVLSIIAACLQLTSASPAARLKRSNQLVPHRVKVEPVDYRGKRASRIVEDGDVANGEAYAVLRNVQFHDGTIEVELAGRPAAGAPETARGFIGIVFRLRDGRFEYIYLRPTNGRADDQVRRNHSTPYSSFPDFDFARLRKEAPEKYEKLRRSRAWRVDAISPRDRRLNGSPVRAWCRATRPRRDRSRTGRLVRIRRCGAMDRTGNGRLLHRIDDTIRAEAQRSAALRCAAGRQQE